MKPYNHLPGYLHRWSVLKFWRFFVRVHDILTPDGTPFLHNHPFYYVTLPLSGGYVERYADNVFDGDLKTRRVKKWRLYFSSPVRYHRIDSVEPGTRTVFFGFTVDKRWSLTRHPDVVAPADYVDYEDGVYLFTDGYRKRQFGSWYRLCSTAEDAAISCVVSIHQSIHPKASS